MRIAAPRKREKEMNELIGKYRVAFAVALLIATVGVLDVRAGDQGETGAAITTPPNNATFMLTENASPTSKNASPV